MKAILLACILLTGCATEASRIEDRAEALRGLDILTLLGTQ